jgi:hypothetical protein
MAATYEKLIRADLPSKELDGLYEELRRASSLFKTTQQLKSEANKLRMNVEHLKKIEDQQWHEI